MFLPILLWVFLVWSQAPDGCHGKKMKRPKAKEEGYAVLIDAGSTGSRMYVYKFRLNRADKVSDVSDVEQLDNSLGKVKPGLSSFADKTDEIPQYIEKFIAEAKKIVPEKDWDSTAFVVLATAGLRLLAQPDQDKIMKTVQGALEDKNFSPFKYKDTYVKVISGKDEAIFGWITVNFVQGILTQRKRVSTYGVLDMGGASTQNAFHPYKNPKGQVKLKLGAKFYRLFAKSYLDMGLASVHELYLEFLAEWPARSNDDEGNIKSPCHHTGFKEVFQIFSGKEELGVVGDPNSDLCRRIVDKMFFCKGYPPCPFKDQPDLRGKLMAFSAFYTIVERIGALKNDDKPVSVQEIGSAAKEFCSKSYNVVKPIDEGYVKFSCLWANYIYELLHEGYQLPDEKRIFVAKELKGFDLSWILGAILKTLNLL